MEKIGLDLKCWKIGVLPLRGFALMAYASTVEPFRAANVLSDSLLYDVINIGLDDYPIASSGAGSVSPQTTIKEKIEVDYLFVVAGGNPVIYENNAIFSWLARMSRFGTRLGGVSAGPAILAKAGLMDGRRMTVHWDHAEALSEIFPHLMIERTLYVIDRDRLTCAGGTAALDLMLGLIRDNHGPLFANRVSDWFLHTEIRPSIGPQRSGLAARVGSTNRVILDAIRTMESHIADPVSLIKLAQKADISPRQLNRLFKDKLGCSTMGYYRVLRLDKARNLLTNSPLPLTEIALASGFANSSHFSTLFSQYFGRPPSEFR
jgi:AraC family transcriptional regulator, glycine betaine-responsive activator